jgi:SAM-dependent methyltransferase
MCPFCRSRLRRLLPIGLSFPVLEEARVVGGGYRENARCPICRSSDRERLVYLYLSQKTDVFTRSLKILHVAPEPRLEPRLRAASQSNYLTADISGKNVMVMMDITNIDAPYSGFDLVLCNHVLEHVVDDRKAMSELYRVLKPGGWAILQTPLSLELRSTYEDFSITSAEGREVAFGQRDHVRIYGQDYEERLRAVGFAVEIFDWTSESAHFGGPKNLFGLNAEECIYICRKEAARAGLDERSGAPTW